MEILKYETDFNKNTIFKEEKIAENLTNNGLASNNITIFSDKKYQSFIGFGAALTESAGYAFSKLPKEKQNDFLNDCFSTSGLGYSISRLPIGSSDFSLHSYSYSNKKDLSDFSIVEDEKYIIPLANRALDINSNICFLSSPWSPPRFMKNTKLLVFGGKLKEKYRQTYADYLCKYILEYKMRGIDIKYITVQNEPNAIQRWESCIYSPEDEANFAINYLYPTFKKNNIDTKILIWDHNKEKLFSRAESEMNYPGADEAISGFAFHWYTGDYFENVKHTSDAFPNKLLIHSEGCTGFSNFNPNEEIQNAEIYAHDIIGDLNSGTHGYIDWNILLMHNGGPNHKNNFCNSPIMLNEDETDYIKNLSYYYIKHFSHFIKANAKRIDYNKNNDNIEITTFENIDGNIIIVILNRNDYEIEFNLNIKNNNIQDKINPHSIISYEIKNI